MALTWDDVTVTDDLVTVTFGGFAIALSARLGTLHELTKLAPAAIIANEALGHNPKTIEAHATASGADYARYVGAIVDRTGSSDSVFVGADRSHCR